MSFLSSVFRLAVASGLVLAFAVAPTTVRAQDQSAESSQTAAPDSSHRVDNSAQNKGHHKTADKQLNNHSDLQITKQVRQAIIADKSLSMYGHNIKVITRNGVVTLKGPVHSAEEKQALMTDAQSAAGGGTVSDQITVKESSGHTSK